MNVPARVKPWTLLNGIVEIPVNYLDYHMLETEIWYPLNEYRTATPSPTILAFHPIHIFLNTDSQEHYEKAKPYSQDPEELETYRNKKKFGAKDYLLSWLELIREYDLETRTLDEINKQFREGKP
jgi:hypothetical protein